jgi:FlgD Ig-like domain/Doubled CXXCH motif (Paired_CXXCH_1)/Cytochrome c554 and c-prime
MKRFVSICFSLLILSLFAGLVFAQTVEIKIEAMSPGRRSSGPPNYTAPPGPNYVSTGLRVVPKGMKVYLSADTAGGVNSFSWSIPSKPTNSTAVIDTPSNQFVTFMADSVGQYVVQVSVNGGATANDTLFASTFTGVAGTWGCGTVCHQDKKTAWQGTAHGSIFTRGITGQLEVDPYTGRGAYGLSCVKCHTTGWEPTAANGNFGYLAHQTNWDSTWFAGLPYEGGDYWITYQDSSIFNAMPASMAGIGNVGCESCHGPGGNHLGDRTKIDVTEDAGICLQCHDAPKKHRLGSYWSASAHAVFPDGEHTANTSCFPCHSGSSFVKWLDNKSAPGWSVAADGDHNVSCTTCHDPHDASNPSQLRTVAFDSLRNGWIPPAGQGGKGQLCMNCHNSRYKQKVKSTPPYYGFGSRFNPHHNNQADMFFGRNSFEFGDASLAGMNTHANLENGCVTCHMAERVNGSSVHPDHEMSMVVDGEDFVEGCVGCHGPITDFDAIRAAYDYDHDGVVEGVKSEVEGMMAVLKSRLPLGSDGEPIGGGTVTAADSAAIYNRPDLVQGIWTYYFVEVDGSMGMHNAKYTVALLQKALGWYPTDVKQTGSEVPTEFALDQNYPNPFNPTTTIRFSLPTDQQVKLEVYDVIGRLVKTIVNKDVAAGQYEVSWDGKDNNNMQVTSGMYLYRLQAGSYSSMKKMILLK